MQTRRNRTSNVEWIPAYAGMTESPAGAGTVLNLDLARFGFVSDFEIRASSFPVRRGYISGMVSGETWPVGLILKT
jgi:hypothetical protein